MRQSHKFATPAARGGARGLFPRARSARGFRRLWDPIGGCVVPLCTLLAPPLLLSSLLSPAPLFPLPLSSFLCAIMLSALVASSFAFCLFCLSAAAVRCFFYVVRSVSPPLVSCSTEPVRAQLLRAAQDQTRSSLAPRSPLPSPLLKLPPSGEGAATSKAVIDDAHRPPPALPPTTACRCFPLCR
jgi:hypothetical protein